VPKASPLHGHPAQMRCWGVRPAMPAAHHRGDGDAATERPARCPQPYTGQECAGSRGSKSTKRWKSSRSTDQRHPSPDAGVVVPLTGLQPALGVDQLSLRQELAAALGEAAPGYAFSWRVLSVLTP
jgi:hypothetical protein